MNTNPISFPQRKSYLKHFTETILKKESEQSKLICKKMYEVLELLVSKSPEAYYPKPVQKECIQIELPKWKLTDTNYKWYLSEVKQELLIDWLSRKFDALFYSHMDNLKCIRYDVAINLFIEEYNIPVQHFDMLKKKDYRNRVAQNSKKNKNINSLFDTESSRNCLYKSYSVLY